MKICPFISHMIGEDRADILQIDASTKSSSTGQSSSKKKKDETSGVVILGYDGEDDGAVGVQTKQAKTKAKTKKDGTTVPSHLFCLKDTCRFYLKKDGACKFDSVFDMSLEHLQKIDQVEKQAKRIQDVESRFDRFDKLDQLDKLEKLGKIDAVDDILKKINEVQSQIKKSEETRGDDAGEKTAAKVAKELEKFWKFQTKSVSELIASLGDAERKQDQSLNELKKQLSSSLDSWKPDIDLKVVEDVKADVTRLREAVESREDGIENFATTVSELVLNIDDTLKALQEKSEVLAERVEKLETAMPQFDAYVTKLEKASNADVSKDIQSLDQRFKSRLDEVTGAYERIADNLDSWRDELDKRVKDISDHQGSWREQLERIEKNQTEVMEVVRGGKDRLDDDATQFRKKEAKKFNNLGVTSFHNGEYELARDEFLEAVGLDPEFAESWNNLGLVYTELEDDDGAREAFSRAIEINPDLPAAYNNLGYIFYKQEDYEMAVEMYNEAIKRNAENSSAYTNLGNAYFKQGNRDEASRAWEKALQIDPANEKASRNLDRLRKG
jgi:tetratricopeptide (TPR) repeat protein